MQHNIDQKEQSRQNNDVCVHRDVVIERHFSDTIWYSFALAAERQRELIKTVAIDWISFSVRGSCLFRLARRRTGISSIKFASLCQSCGFNRSARCPALLTTKSSTPIPILSVFSPISTTALAGVRKSRPLNKGRCFEGTTLKTIRPFLPATEMGAVALIEETSVPPSPNLHAAADTGFKEGGGVWVWGSSNPPLPNPKLV